MATYRFKGRAAGCDPTGYFYPRWDRAQAVEVLAESKAEATDKARVMLGKHPRFGDWQSSGWAIQWDSIAEEPAA